MIESRIAVRTENAATSASASSGPPIAPRLSSSARSRRRARTPRAAPRPRGARSGREPEARGPSIAYAEERDLPKSRGRPDQPGEDRDARITADRRGAASRRIVRERSADEPRDSREPIGESLDAPRAAADPPSDVMNRGRSAVGTSCPRSDNGLAARTPPTPGVSHFAFDAFVSAAATLRERSRGETSLSLALTVRGPCLARLKHVDRVESRGIDDPRWMVVCSIDGCRWIGATDDAAARATSP